MRDDLERRADSLLAHLAAKPRTFTFVVAVMAGLMFVSFVVGFMIGLAQ